MRAVDRRAGLLTQEYTRKARTVDRLYGGTQEGEVGRVESRLQSYGRVRGLVFGAWGEASEDVHALVQALASSRQEVGELLPGAKRRGQKSQEQELASLVGQVRRQLSVAAVQAQACCLLQGLEALGEEAGAASKRRQQALMAETSWRKERQAQALCLKQGRRVLRTGFFKLD